MGSDELRIGDAERRAAMELLAEHHEAGRLDSHEFEDRRGRAADAVTRHDLDVLFSDLPALGRDRRPLPVAGRTEIERARSGWARVRTVVLALTPFLALALFLRTGSLLWFVLVPVVAVISSAITED
ncbi:DUF1707 domain-containing protein [Intrasporangium calvum]|uniref:DUF1707 domain-containing protein n=1 Tax=Intrasporangium calvum TaxID=53358 RepID=A0ABT5GBT3_9MICO|nr:DUF1707 domain-containing protein [Intrasporangium calvum]MDC5695742.1 DUF1707 domain-containing protein [Intrasporangium calvum]